MKKAIYFMDLTYNQMRGYDFNQVNVIEKRNQKLATNLQGITQFLLGLD